MKEELARLKKLDMATWKRIARGMPLQSCGQYMTYDHGEVTAHQYQEAYISFDQMLPETAMAWLQWCLQEAIRGKKLFFTVAQTTPGPRGEEYRVTIRYRRIYADGEARIFGEDPWPEIAICDGKTPVAALMAAYIAALESQG